MEFICHCAAKAWRLRLVAHDLVPATWLRGMFEIAVQPLPEAQHVSPDLWLFEDSRREFATDTDPVIEVHLRDDGLNAEAWVTLDGRETRLDNRVPAPPDPAVGDLVRIATPEETLELGLRWFIAHEHLGCREPEELWMWGKLTTATAYAIDDVQSWLAAGTPLPGAAPGTPGLAVFLARLGTFSHVQAAIDSIEARCRPKVLGQGVYSGDEPRMLVAVGRIVTPLDGENASA